MTGLKRPHRLLRRVEGIVGVLPSPARDRPGRSWQFTQIWRSVSTKSTLPSGIWGSEAKTIGVDNPIDESLEVYCTGNLSTAAQLGENHAAALLIDGETGGQTGPF